MRQAAMDSTKPRVIYAESLERHILHRYRNATIQGSFDVDIIPHSAE